MTFVALIATASGPTSSGGLLIVVNSRYQVLYLSSNGRTSASNSENRSSNLCRYATPSLQNNERVTMFPWQLIRGRKNTERKCGSTVALGTRKTARRQSIKQNRGARPLLRGCVSINPSCRALVVLRATPPALISTT